MVPTYIMCRLRPMKIYDHYAFWIKNCFIVHPMCIPVQLGAQQGCELYHQQQTFIFVNFFNQCYIIGFLPIDNVFVLFYLYLNSLVEQNAIFLG